MLVRLLVDRVLLILARIEAILQSTAPTILTGDFNVGPESDAYRTIITNTSFKDAKYATHSPHYGPSGTCSTFKVRHQIGKRLDYVFVSSAYFNVLRHQHSTYSEDSYYPSDHLPVIADLAFKPFTHPNPNNDRMRYRFWHPRW